MHATCIGHKANIIQLSGPEHAVQTVFTPPCPACPAAALDSNLQVSFGNFVGHFRVRAKKKRRQDVPRSNPSSPFNLQFDMHSPDCDFMAFGKTNFAMLLGSGPSKKFNMQSFFKTLRNGLIRGPSPLCEAKGFSPSQRRNGGNLPPNGLRKSNDSFLTNIGPKTCVLRNCPLRALHLESGRE